MPAFPQYEEIMVPRSIRLSCGEGGAAGKSVVRNSMNGLSLDETRLNSGHIDTGRGIDGVIAAITEETKTRKRLL